MACTPSFTCAPHSRIRALQPRLRETLSKCPLQTLHYYNISTHNISPKQTTISSLTQRLLRGGGHGMPRLTGHSWSCPEEKGHPSLRDDLGRQRQRPTTMIQFPPTMDENWLRYELLNLGQIYETKLAEDVVLCVHNTTSALNR